MKLTEEHKKFLNELQDSGRANMWGAVPHLQKEFCITEKEAEAILFKWMDITCREGD